MKPGPAKQFDQHAALLAAVHVFWNRGYEAASLSELTAAMGIGKKSLYDTYGNKRALFLQSVAYYSDLRLEKISQVLLKDGSPLKNIKAFLDLLKKEHSCEGSKGCLLGTNIADFDTSDAEIAALLRQKLNEFEAVFYQAISNAIEAGEVDAACSAKTAAQMMTCVTQGMALIGRVSHSSDTLEGAKQSMLNFLRPR
ncbi:TetR/AcrR family transcriptional regulator [Coraliomargarita parva]|uniref:TetR/AcrR family transcriptional regulator n=1 Tax=Coraliomargarita parva TaxID=3014050 RepID=UPI0022B540EE|nr:TetR/AcrR family transcriptional regulator [Coraliomargarita parva]